MTDSVIECRNLTHYYGERLIYKDLSFEVPRGRILGLLGKNGTGKTTTINILSGYLRPRAGECLIFGEDIRTMSPRTRARIALLIEGHVQYAFMTIEQIERFYSKFYPRWNRDAYYGLMEKLRVAPRQRISRMSFGQRSQVALGLILAQVAELLATFRRYTFDVQQGAVLPAGSGIYHPAVLNGRAELYSFDSPATVQGVLQRAGIACGDLKAETMNLEDAFIGLTGKY